MSAEVRIVDYGMGNLFSVCRAFESCGGQPVLTDTASGIFSAERLVLPGVGAFRDGIEGLEQRNLLAPLREYAKGGRPLLGICLGMQMLFDVSEELGLYEGLGVIPGRVVAIPHVGSDGTPHKIPHIGWNQLELFDGLPTWKGTLLEGIFPGDAVYFVHSYHAVPEYSSARLGDTFYDGVRIAATIRSESVYGCQFHPEKSGPIGLRILRNFLQLNGCT